MELFLFVFQSLYKKFRGILNRLTPQKFNKLLEQVRQMKIDNVEKLKGVIDLVFVKVRSRHRLGQEHRVQ